MAKPKSDDGTKGLTPNIDKFYGNLKNYVRMVTNGYSNMLMLDAKGGLGKTHNVVKTLSEELEHDDKWIHKKGFTTPIELYKTLWQARSGDKVLFLDDMSGVTSNTKAIDMLKAATDTQGDENVVEYHTSRDIDHPTMEGQTLPNAFTFRGTIIMSFNDTPDNRHFEALMDRGTYYNLTFDYQERLELITEIAKKEDFSLLTVSQQLEVADWIKTVTDPSFEVTIRSFDEICKMRAFGETEGANWKKMGLEIFNLDYEKYLILDMRKNSEMSVEDQREAFKEKTGKSDSHYYNKLDELRDERDL